VRADQMTNTISNLPSKMLSEQKQYKCSPLAKSSDILRCFYYHTNTQTNNLRIAEEYFYISAFQLL